MSDDDEYCTIQDVFVKHMTPKALLVIVDNEEYWVPLSQVSPDSEVYNDTSANEGSLMVKQWLADKMGVTSDGDAVDDAKYVFGDNDFAEPF